MLQQFCSNKSCLRCLFTQTLNKKNDLHKMTKKNISIIISGCLKNGSLKQKNGSNSDKHISKFIKNNFLMITSFQADNQF